MSIVDRIQGYLDGNRTMYEATAGQTEMAQQIEDEVRRAVVDEMRAKAMPDGTQATSEVFSNHVSVTVPFENGGEASVELTITDVFKGKFADETYLGLRPTHYSIAGGDTGTGPRVENAYFEPGERHPFSRELAQWLRNLGQKAEQAAMNESVGAGGDAEMDIRNAVDLAQQGIRGMRNVEVTEDPFHGANFGPDLNPEILIRHDEFGEFAVGLQYMGGELHMTLFDHPGGKMITESFTPESPRGIRSTLKTMFNDMRQRNESTIGISESTHVHEANGAWKHVMYDLTMTSRNQQGIRRMKRDLEDRPEVAEVEDYTLSPIKGGVSTPGGRDGDPARDAETTYAVSHYLKVQGGIESQLKEMWRELTKGETVRIHVEDVLPVSSGFQESTVHESSDGSFPSKQAALKELGRPDSEGQWLVTAPDGKTYAAYGRTASAAISTALHNMGYRESLRGDSVAVQDQSMVGRWEALGYNGRTEMVDVVGESNSRHVHEASDIRVDRVKGDLKSAKLAQHISKLRRDGHTVERVEVTVGNRTEEGVWVKSVRPGRLDLSMGGLIYQFEGKSPEEAARKWAKEYNVMASNKLDTDRLREGLRKRSVQQRGSGDSLYEGINVNKLGSKLYEKLDDAGMMVREVVGIKAEMDTSAQPLLGTLKFKVFTQFNADVMQAEKAIRGLFERPDDVQVQMAAKDEIHVKVTWILFRI